MRGIIRRGLRLKLIAGLAIVLAMPALALAAGVATTTTLTAGTQSGCTQALTVDVTASGKAASGSVYIEDTVSGSEVQLTGVVLSNGTASTTVPLSSGNHTLTAVFVGNSSYLTSTSSSTVDVDITSPCSFVTAVSPATASLTAGQSATATVSLTPSAAFVSSSTPTTITLSCTGLPDQSTCTFTPASPEISSTTTGAVTSSMVLGTQAASTTSLKPLSRRGAGPIAWAFLLPGGVGLIGFAWGGRRRRWLRRLSLMALVGLVTTLGATACNPRYDYLNHGPSPNLATPSGSYAIIITAQYSNGVTAITQKYTTLALTVQ